jgi:hypothetical protein
MFLTTNYFQNPLTCVIILFITSNRSVPELYVAGQSYIFYNLWLSVSLICLVAYRYTPQIGV